MDVDIRKFAIGVVGFSMAVVGFFLSVTAPIVVAVLPHLQAQAPESLEVYGKQRRRIQPRTSSKSIAPHVDPSDSASAASSNTTKSSVPLSPTLSTTAFSPASSPTSPGRFSHELSSSSTPHAKLERSCRSVAQHVCTAHACSNSASTSVHESASSPQPSHQVRVKSKSRDRGDVPRPTRSGSWLTASPKPPFYLQLSPRSSSESSRAPRSVSPSHSSTSNHDVSVHHHRPVMRRASTFLRLRRTHKAPVRAGSVPSLRPTTMLTLVPLSVPETVAEGRRSEPSTPSPALHGLSEEHFDSETMSHEEKGGMSYFAKLKSKHKNKVSGKARQLHDAPEDMLESAAQHSEHGHERENRHRRRSLCARDRKAATAPTAPPRTRPYEAPYFFPAPASPEAVDYVQRTRNEYRQASISPPSFTKRTLHRDVPAPTPDSSAGFAGPSQGHQSASIPPHATASLHSAPAHHVNFAPTLPEKHRKTASATVSGSPTVDEFGLGLSPFGAKPTSVSGH